MARGVNEAQQVRIGKERVDVYVRVRAVQHRRNVWCATGVGCGGGAEQVQARTYHLERIP